MQIASEGYIKLQHLLLGGHLKVIAADPALSSASAWQQAMICLEAIQILSHGRHTGTCVIAALKEKTRPTL